MAYTTPSTFPVGTLIGTTKWKRNVVDNIIMLAEGPWTVRTGITQSVPTATWTRLTFDTVVDGSTRAGLIITYSTATDLFSFPVTGRYRVISSHHWAGDSSVGNSREFAVATATGAGPGAPIANIDLEPRNTTGPVLGGCLAAEAIISSTTQHISIKAVHDAGVNLNVFAHSTGLPKRISIRWVGKV